MEILCSWSMRPALALHIASSSLQWYNNSVLNPKDLADLKSFKIFHVWHFEHRLSQTTFHYNHQSSSVSKLGLFWRWKMVNSPQTIFCIINKFKCHKFKVLSQVNFNKYEIWIWSASKLQSRPPPWSCEPELASAEEDTLFCVNTNCF